MNVLEGFLDSSVRTATPLMLAALGELIAERAGVINVGLEGFIIAGAFGALVGSTYGPVAGIAVGIGAAVALALLFHLSVDWIGTDQIVTGTAITLLALGATGALYRGWYGSAGAALTIASVPAMPIPILSGIPLLGSVLFDQPPTTYLLYFLVPTIWWWMHRTHSGLSLRGIGESPAACVVSGVPVRRLRLGAMVASGILGGLAGATLVVAQVGTFAEGMSAGRGFIAIAIVVLGGWSPVGVAAAAMLFGAATALQYHVQALGLDLPYQLILALPYVTTLAALAGMSRRVAAPAALGKPLLETISR